MTFKNAYDLNAINKIALKTNIKPLTAEQMSKMTKAEIKNYLKSGAKTQRANRVNLRRSSRALRANAKLTSSENYKRAALVHGTIRQGLAELGGLVSEGIATNSINKSRNQALNAINQNIDGGTDQKNGSSSSSTLSGEPRVNFSFKGRDED